jgi:hypothetical protein
LPCGFAAARFPAVPNASRRSAMANSFFIRKPPLRLFYLKTVAGSCV